MPDESSFILELRNELAAGGETPNREFKGPESWTNRPFQIKLIRTILAMANTQDGGRIIIGVDDKTFQAVGLSGEQLVSFDATRVNQQLRKFADPFHSCEVRKVNLDEKDLVILDVREFDITPILCKNSTAVAGSDEKLRDGALYIRNQLAETSEVTTAADMRMLLDRALLKNGAALVRQIDALFRRHAQLIQEARNNEEDSRAQNERLNDLTSRIGEVEIE